MEYAVANEPLATTAAVPRREPVVRSAVDRLEKLGYVQRLHAADDRRKVMVQITRKGIDLVGTLRDTIATNIESVMVSQASGKDNEDSIYSQLKEFVDAR